MTRAFSPQAIEPDTIDSIIAEAARAPSAGKSQGWHAVVLTGADTSRFWDVTLPPERRDRFGWPKLLDAPVVMVIVADPETYFRRYSEPDKAATGLGRGMDAWPAPYWTIDASMAAMTILFGAEARGLGALFFGVFNGEDELRRVLKLPDRLEIIGVIALGHPAHDRPGRSSGRPTRTSAEIIHRGQWSQ